MQFGLTEMVFPFDDLSRSIECVADAGYDGIELLIDEERLDDHSLIEEAADIAAQHDLEIPSIVARAGSGAPLSSLDDTTRQAAIDRGETIIREIATGLLEVDTVLVVPGGVDASTRYDIAYERSLDAIQTLAAVASDVEITLGIENVWNDMLYSPLEFAEFVDEANTAGPAQAYFDVGNVRRFGHPEHWIHILGDRIAAIHVKDFIGDIGNHHGFTYPLQGDVDWNAVTHALDTIGYNGWVIPEVTPFRTAPERMPAAVLDDLEAIFE